MSARDWRTIGLDAPREPAPLPPWLGWAVPPLIVPLVAMAWLASTWDRIPSRYATHFGPGNQPNGWQTRTPLHVFGMPIFAEGMVVLLFALMLCTWYGSRQSGPRSSIEKILLAVQYLLSLVFTMVGLSPVAQLPVWPMAVAIPLAALGTIIYVVGKQGEPDDSIDDTPGECWSLGGIYYNPRDPSLFVRARLGFGYTLNMANRWSYAFLIGLFFGVSLLVAFLFWSQR